ncbi:MAG: hypothetical protein K6C33_01525 [Desulfovibrio sp.]|nr:hypothetical protein [Desulfovibrio sp.]
MRDELNAVKRKHKTRLLLLALATAAALACAIFVTLTSIDHAKRDIVAEAQQGAQEELAALAERIGTWNAGLASTAASISQANLFQVFVSDFATSEERIAKLEEVKRDENVPEHDIVSYLGDLLAEFAREYKLQNACILLPDGRVLLGEPLPEVKASLGGTAPIRVVACRQDKDDVYARAVAPVFPLATDSRPAAYLVFDAPLDEAFAKALSGVHPYGCGLVMQDGEVTLSGATVGFAPARGLPALKEGSFVEGRGTRFNCYRRTQVPCEGYLRAYIPSSVVDGRIAAAQWDILLLAATAVVAILTLAIALFIAAARAMERSLNERIGQQHVLLESINSSVDDGIMLIADDGTVQYRNRYFTQGDAEKEWAKDALANILPADTAEAVLDKTAEISAAQKGGSMETHIMDNGDKRLYRVSLFPYATSKIGQKGLCVALFKDITEFRRRALEQKRRVESLLDVFACAMESVEKGFAGHTHKMLAVLGRIKDRIALSPDEMETLRIASRIQSISKLFIPPEILYKEGRLTDDDRDKLRKAQELANTVIRNFDFHLPVADTIVQSGERVNGTGRPAGLKGDAILKTARVLAVVNAFCAMTSPRKHRAAMTPAVAKAELERDAGYDQEIVASLALVQDSDVVNLDIASQQDGITEYRKRALEAKQRAERLLDVFACAMESVEKGFAGHSRKMLAVVSRIKDELGLTDDESDTLAVAARIQGISKLFIPHEILVKEGKLTEDEHAKIREAQTMANSLIQSFDFHLPVSDTINQSTERMDGTGRPAGLKGEAILKTARVLAAINAFCAMTSPRKYRGAMTPEAAIAELEANPGYDQQVVASLRQVTQEDIAG